MLSIEEYIKENEKRKAPREYDPVSGLGAWGERTKVVLSEFDTLYLPVAFTQVGWIKRLIKLKSVSAYCKRFGFEGNESRIILEFIKERFKHDCEFWLATQCYIKVKNKPVDDLLIPSQTQRKVLYDILDDWYAELPVRFIVVKCRQAFITTIVAAFNMWVQITQFKNWNSLLVGDVENQATNIRGVQDKIIKSIMPSFTDECKALDFRPFEGSSKTRVLVPRNCKVSTGSMQRPENVRANDNSSGHCTEVGLWKTTLGKTPEDLIQAIRGGMDDVAYTVFGLESSPKGVGNYFHQQWQAAKNGESDLKPIFLPWFLVDRYQTPIKGHKGWAMLLDAMHNGKHAEYLQYLWRLGCTLEQINWYIGKLKTMEHWRVQSEWPSDDIEAFQSTGSRAFGRDDVHRRRLECIEPIFIGDVLGRDTIGEDALKDVHFETQGKNLKIWSYPDKDMLVANRYLIIVDIGKGKSTKSDNSDILVLDRGELMYDGKVEVVAEWHGKIDIDMLAWKAAQLGVMYHSGEYPLLIIEKNTIDTITDYHQVLLAEIADYYDNLYARVDVDKKTGKEEKTWGWHTNSATKPLLVSALNSGLRDDTYRERNKYACDEMDTYEKKEDGSFGSADKCHDDTVVTRGIGLHVSSRIALPYEIKRGETKIKKPIGYSSY